MRDVVWSCDDDRASGFDGFTFQIPKKILGSSEIPKVDNPILIKDDIPISLIGIHSNFIVKLLANRLAKVV